MSVSFNKNPSDKTPEGSIQSRVAEFVSVERDPDDVITISHLVRLLFILTILLALSCGLNFYLALRKADLVVVDKTSGRTLAINNRDYGATETVSLAPDNPTNRDKRALVEEFLRCLYEVNAATRPAQVNRLLKMMEPNLSLSQARLFDEQKLLVQEKNESLNSTWEIQDIVFDERDPYLVRAMGKRTVRRVRGDGANIEEQTQIKIKFLLMDSPTTPARHDNNYRTGFYVQKYRAEAVDRTRSTPLFLLSDDRTAGGWAIVVNSDNATNNASAAKK